MQFVLVYSSVSIIGGLMCPRYQPPIPADQVKVPAEVDYDGGRFTSGSSVCDLIHWLMFMF